MPSANYEKEATAAFEAPAPAQTSQPKYSKAKIMNKLSGLSFDLTPKQLLIFWVSVQLIALVYVLSIGYNSIFTPIDQNSKLNDIEYINIML